MKRITLRKTIDSMSKIKASDLKIHNSIEAVGQILFESYAEGTEFSEAHFTIRELQELKYRLVEIKQSVDDNNLYWIIHTIDNEIEREFLLDIAY